MVGTGHLDLDLSLGMIMSLTALRQSLNCTAIFKHSGQSKYGL